MKHKLISNSDYIIFPVSYNNSKLYIKIINNKLLFDSMLSDVDVKYVFVGKIETLSY
jgi:hypothetical protein